MGKLVASRIGRVHAVIPDCQVRPGVNTDHLSWISNYLHEKKPDVIVCLGDFADMVSLNSYAVGKASAEGTRYRDDLDSARKAMDRLCKKLPKADMHLTLGNHEDRIDREVESNPKWSGTHSSKDLWYEAWGWKVHPFLRPVKIDGVEYAHYFTSGALGRPVSSARALLNKRHGSAVMGHVQQRDIAIHSETQHTAIFAGICYTHKEAYLGPQGNVNRPGIWMLHEVHNGIFDPMFVSLAFLKRRYS